MRKLPILLFTAVFALSLALPAYAAESSNEELKAASQYLNSHGIMVGDGEGNMNFSAPLTRAHLATILARLHGGSGQVEESRDFYAAQCQFQDVPDWARQYAGYCAYHGLMVGYGDGLFGAEDPVTPAAACTVILRYLALPDLVWDYNSACSTACDLGLSEPATIHWLTEYGALTKTQVVRMLKDKPPQTAEKIIRGLKRDVLLYDISGGYYLGVDPMCQPDPRMILAVWVLLQFIDKVEPMAHYPATYPSQIFFLKEDIGYEIVVLYDGEQHLARLLQPQEDLRYIFVLPHIRMAQELVLPSVPCLFATVDYNGQEVPDVRFYTESEGGRDGAV